MTDFVNQFHRPSMILMFDAYSNGLAKYYKLYQEERANQTEFDQILIAFEGVTRRHWNDIIAATGNSIAQYMYTYAVQTKEGVDEYKIIYYMGCALAAYLEKYASTLEASVIRYAIVVMLDERLKKYLPGGRPELKQRLTYLIREKSVEKKLGADGMYLIYKCSSRMLRDTLESHGIKDPH